MKKLYMIITLFVSSFFLFNSDVKASTEVEVNISSLDLINENFKKNIDLADNYLLSSTVYDNYFIYYDSSNKMFKYIFYNSSNIVNNNFSCYYYSNSFECGVISSYKFFNYISWKNDFVNEGGGIDFKIKDINYICYSSLPIYLDDTLTLKINYNNMYFTLEPGDKMMFLYDVYENQERLFDVHYDEKNSLSNFYNLCLNKLSYLTGIIVGNYIYLSIFGIFILIIIFELIRRRFL